MIPLRDNLRSHSLPIMTIGLIISNFYVFYQELRLSDRALTAMIQQYGLTPIFLIEAINAASTAVADYSPLFSNLFLHGGWLHIIGNMWYLWLFGDNVEDWLGRLPFLAFFLLTGLIANLTHILLDPFSTIPVIGASGAVSGILGAYLILYPTARIKTLVPIFIFLQIFEIPAMLFLGLWFFLQLQGSAAAGSNIAWWAHVGGFLAGMLLIKIFPCRCKRSYFR
ncbi:MAG: rhomboid family intramembrane serine protease [Sporomusaceae bacterium]|nr:rhomboid family intramembrane serine protease [Sporomusaceae bacterium]